MTRPARLDERAAAARLAELPGWTIEDGKLTRTFRFADFNAAFGFMARAALVAESMDHHPEWCNVWARVDVHLTTHDAGGLTELDFTLASAMSRIAGTLPASPARD